MPGVCGGVCSGVRIGVCVGVCVGVCIVSAHSCNIAPISPLRFKINPIYNIPEADGTRPISTSFRYPIYASQKAQNHGGMNQEATHRGLMYHGAHRYQGTLWGMRRCEVQGADASLDSREGFFGA